jgi:hypothetical protein
VRTSGWNAPSSACDLASSDEKGVAAPFSLICVEKLATADIWTRSGAIIRCIVGLSIRYASTLFAHAVSPPNGGISTLNRVLIDGGCGRKAESVCHDPPKIALERVAASLMTG